MRTLHNNTSSTAARATGAGAVSRSVQMSVTALLCVETEEHLRSPAADAAHGHQFPNNLIVAQTVHAFQVQTAVYDVSGQIFEGCYFRAGKADAEFCPRYVTRYPVH